MIQLKNKLWGLLLILPGLSFSQNYQWQWGKQAGGLTGSADPGFHYVFDESIRDIVVDDNNNTYYLATMREQGQNLNGTSVTNYGLSDLFLFSADCAGNIRWSRPIGGSGDGENAWHIKVDNNGGLYVMATIYNNSYIGDPNAVPVHFDDTHTQPLYTYYDQTTEPAHKAAFLLKYNTSDGTLAWSKPLQGDVNYFSRMCDVQMMYMDSAKNIHAVMGFRAGTHLNGLITVPSTFTSTYQYYAVKFNYDGGNMTPVAPLLLPITGNAINIVGREGKVNVVYDEGLNRYYIAGKRMDPGFSNLVDLSYNNVPFTKAAYVFAFDGTTGAEVWRKELNNGTTSTDDEIHSIIKDPVTSDIYISGRYFNGITVPATFGSYTFPLRNYVEAVPFVMKMNAAGTVQWARTPDGMSGLQFGYRFTKGTIAINGNEIAFAKGSWSDIWGSYAMVRPDGDRSDPLLVRLNKDTGDVLGTGEIRSNYYVIDEFTAVAADKDGNYVVGGFFHDQLFTEANDNVNTMAVNVAGGKSQSFFTKFAKSACSQMSVEETAAQAGIQLYPNPVQEVLNIRSREPLVSYEIFGATGQLVKQGTLNMMQEQIVVSSLQTGVYYVKLKTKSSTVTEKILKK
ncbi:MULTISPECIES: T9SS type A sorting domain-containing protein [unclassified Chryseobacterium]|uniref:T9SS type A sorting domain-containing protein n=1 Tax=unclassified Chryseobacterium TaxID=2593645 RepID=UPI0028534499|nr:T9SS type A sorting domain-containing protein [Chryseobacterium sp. CFS7]MDR4892698.1 T9SS type A sorting domain-containing protein [Chryseobacterium sp. CFS7]